jgi:predicted dienelactone hydrolase
VLLSFASRFLRALAGAVAGFALAGSPAASETIEVATYIGGIESVVWIANAPAGEQPVVVFSHGMHMCPTQSRYLTRALADAGYVVIAPRHSDSNCNISITGLHLLAWKPSAWWGERDYRERAEDIRKLVAALPRDKRFEGRVDMSRLALAGHSLGGYTVLGLGGAWPSWRLPGVRAILALTPYALPFQSTEGLRNLTAPVMYQTGRLDPVFTLPIELFGYEQSPAPKYFVEFSTAAHLAWTDMGLGDRDAIVGYALAFFDRHVKDAPAGTALTTQLPGVARFEHVN